MKYFALILAALAVYCCLLLTGCVPDDPNCLKSQAQIDAGNTSCVHDYEEEKSMECQGTLQCRCVL